MVITVLQNYSSAVCMCCTILQLSQKHLCSWSFNILSITLIQTLKGKNKLELVIFVRLTYLPTRREFCRTGTSLVRLRCLRLLPASNPSQPTGVLSVDSSSSFLPLFTVGRRRVKLFGWKICEGSLVLAVGADVSPEELTDRFGEERSKSMTRRMNAASRWNLLLLPLRHLPPESTRAAE